MDMLNLNSRERKLAFSLLDAFSSSLDLSEVFSHARGSLFQLLPADSAAMCVSRPGQPATYEWLVAEMPVSYFDKYPELTGDDFVRTSAVSQPNVVLRDTEMVSREVLERSSLYRHGRELGMPMEHVMAVMLAANEDWHAGLMLYRERRRPFSKRTRELLQWLTPRLTATVHNCRRFAEEVKHRQFLDALGRHQKDSLLVISPPSMEVKRTGLTTELLEKWFTVSERGHSGLPKVLLEKLSVLVRAEGGMRLGLDTWEREGPDGKLKVAFVRLPVEGRPLWVLTLEEVPRDLLSTWRRMLTPGQAKIADCLLLGYTNEDIAGDLHCAVGTVKKQLTRIYKTLGVDGRADFISRALRP
ncbi:helix-turn-helix transcriptional regulator [Archangium lansingense]|uniref:Helix-turn-helix transcriptional regulator n=1 Tax=Archangium lansingense TaxID=2995310 RepID=A0ABT3ZZB3_9BACT|nr:helix-turn-helix transcriptional regulator [Archangium lansinium]MCY1074743.1 helix-turn-helix transcriptional regulator [Archangium lansinium]